MIKRFFAILIMCSFLVPVLAEEEQGPSSTLINQESIETLSKEDNAELNNNTQSFESDVLPAQTSLPSAYKEPTSKKKLAKKFIIAMLCVAGTSVFLYATLSFYNRIRYGLFTENMFSDEETPLDTPQDISEAVRAFVDKTRWQ